MLAIRKAVDRKTITTNKAGKEKIMKPRKQLSMRSRPALKQPSRKLAALCAAGLLAFGSVEMPALGRSQPPLTEAARQRADQQIQALTTDKAQRTKTQLKLDSQLIYAARQKATGLVHPAAPKLRPSLRAEADGRIKVDIKGTVTPQLLAAIQAAGGTIISSLPGYHVLQAVLPLENIEALAARDEVLFIRPAQKPMHNYVDSEGDTTHEAIQARATYGATGAGIKVGILSDSIDNGTNALAAAIASGNIDATNTFVIPGQAGTGEGEGLAMCEIVHDLAPKATLYFATGDPNDAQMASNILALAQAGCRIIADDISYPDESPFQDGVIAQAVNTVSAMGVLYFSCARNSGNLDSHNACTWEGDFVNGRSTTYGEELAFSSGVVENAILTGGYDFAADLFWSDPLGASSNDYDLYMIDSIGDIIYSSTNPQTGTQDPYEHIADPAQYSSGYYLVVTLYSGTNRFIHLDFGRGLLDWVTPGCIRGHNACDAANSFTVAATPAATAYATGDPTGPYPNPFNSSDVVEYFSSDGPRRMFYNPDGSAITPGNFSSTGGRVLQKPDLTAADGVTTTPPGFAPFFGTSAATPHAAAIAALVLSYNPTLTPAQVRTVLTNSCIDIMASGWDRDSGCGILMATTALQNTPPPVLGPPPALGITAYSNRPVLIFPTAAGTGHVLQMTTNLTSGSWTTITNGVPFTGVEITNGPSPAFFRLY
jgi:subtilisin family serine protease